MKNTQSVHFDNIATASHPVYRRRMRAPFTVFAVRMDLIAQAAELPEYARDAYIDERLTELDRALSCDEAEALERWLDAEQLLQGRPATIGEGGGGGGRSSLLADDVMDALAEHAEVKASLGLHSRRVLARLAQMMDAPQWTMDARFVDDVHKAAAKLTKLHMC